MMGKKSQFFTDFKYANLSECENASQKSYSQKYHILNSYVEKKRFSQKLLLEAFSHCGKFACSKSA
jgi:hypothetical protein